MDVFKMGLSKINSSTKPVLHNDRKYMFATMSQRVFYSHKRFNYMETRFNSNLSKATSAIDIGKALKYRCDPYGYMRTRLLTNAAMCLKP